ncbi:acyltransferase family protein [Mesorhizobium sp. NPDC059025]|uniref:acyltransferase family protein n=1 Tax=unclassified Mesorhizobium TaxID=325217 RepID=UPI00369E2121
MRSKHDDRPDIDGLRAIAVLCVVFFHYGANWLPGGFAGVDVFFVISGYLITKQLTESIDHHRWLWPVLFDFYGRRIRRIFPALIVVLAATLAAGWFLLIPGDYQTAGSSAAYATVGFGNLHFYWNTSYFDRSAELQLLIHTWSLGVEEQFYLVWPVLLFGLLMTVPRRWTSLIITLMILAGLAYSARTVAVNPKAAFYLPQSRAWELGAGALLVFLPTITNRLLSEATVLVGLALVSLSVFTLQGSETALGLSMVPTVLGSALIVCRKQGTIASNMLGSTPFRGIGLISYSLYLWHWPILVFYRLTHFEQLPTGVDLVVLLALTFGLSYLSYRFVELPIVKKPVEWALPTIPAALAVVVAGNAVASQEGYPERLTTEAAALYASTTDFSKHRPNCHRNDNFQLPLEKSCAFGAQSAAPTAAVWSDSHGVEIADALGDIEAPKGKSVVSLTYSSCPPSLDYASPDHQIGCRPFNTDALGYLLDRPEIRTIIMTAFYEYYLGKPESDRFVTGFEAAVSKLSEAGKRVILIASNPVTGYAIPQAAARSAMTTPRPEISLPLTQLRRETQVSRDLLDTLARRYRNVEVVDPADSFCADQTCSMIAEGKPLLFDDNHLTLTSARKIAAKISLAGPAVTGTSTSENVK